MVVLSMNAPDLYPKWARTDGRLKSVAVRLNYWEGAVNLSRQRRTARLPSVLAHFG